MDTQDKFTLYRSITLSTDEKIRFCTRLAAMEESGKGVAEFLRTELETVGYLEGKKPNKKTFLIDGKRSDAISLLVKELGQVVLDHGKDFPDAARLFPGAFDPQLVALLVAGQKNGEFAPVLRMYVGNLIALKKMRNTIISALIYPALVVVAAIAVTVLFLLVIVPGMKELYEGLVGKEPLPGPTQAVIQASDFLVGNWAIWLPASVGAVVGYMYARQRYRELSRAEQKLALKLPVFGQLIAQLDTVNFLRTYVMLMAAGSLPTDALYLAAETVGNFELREAIRDASDAFGRGVVSTLTQALAVSYPAFAPGSSFYNEFRTYEETGKLYILERYADLVESNAAETRDRIVAMIEPAIMIVLGVIIGFLVIAMYLPMFALIGKMAGGR